MGSIIVYLLILVAGGSLADMSSPAERYKAWVAETENWKRAVANWKKSVEASCNVSDANDYWREAFACPDIPDITCYDENARETNIDPLGCSTTKCMDGLYTDPMAFLDMWRQNLNTYKASMSIWANKLAGCAGCERKCLDSDAVTLEAWNSQNLKYSELSIALLEAKGKIDQLQNKSEGMNTMVENYANLSSAVSETGRLIAKLENQSSAWNELSETCSELTSGLMEANKKIDHLETQTAALDALTEKQTELSNSVLEAKGQIQVLANEGADQAQKYTELSNLVTETNEQMTQIQTETAGRCPVRYNGKCYWIEYRHPRVTIEEGRDICTSQGATLANIYSEMHHYMLLGHLRTLPDRYGGAVAWIGMTYNTQTKTVSLSDGTPIAYEKWYEDYPMSDQSSNMFLQAHVIWDSPLQHLVNAKADWTAFGSICEK